MNSDNISKLVNVIIYLLTFVLICMILYNLFLLFAPNHSSLDSPKNSVKVSPELIEEA